MDPATNLFLRQKLGRFSSGCSMALGRIRNARTLQDVVRALNVHADAMIRSLGEVRQLQNQLKHAAEARAETFVAELLKRLRAEGAADEKTRLARDVHEALRSLQGNFPRLYVNLDRAAKTAFRAPAAPADPQVSPPVTPTDPE